MGLSAALIGCSNLLLLEAATAAEAFRTSHAAAQPTQVKDFDFWLSFCAEEAAQQAGLEPNRYAVEFSERALGKRSLIDLVSASREENTVARAWEYIESVRKLSRLPLALMPQWYEVYP